MVVALACASLYGLAGCGHDFAALDTEFGCGTQFLVVGDGCGLPDVVTVSTCPARWCVGMVVDHMAFKHRHVAPVCALCVSGWDIVNMGQCLGDSFVFCFGALCFVGVGLLPWCQWMHHVLVWLDGVLAFSMCCIGW